MRMCCACAGSLHGTRTLMRRVMNLGSLPNSCFIFSCDRVPTFRSSSCLPDFSMVRARARVACVFPGCSCSRSVRRVFELLQGFGAPHQLRHGPWTGRVPADLMRRQGKVLRGGDSAPGSGASVALRHEQEPSMSEHPQPCCCLLPACRKQDQGHQPRYPSFLAASVLAPLDTSGASPAAAAKAFVAFKASRPFVIQYGLQSSSAAGLASAILQVCHSRHPHPPPQPATAGFAPTNRASRC